MEKFFNFLKEIKNIKKDEIGNAVKSFSKKELLVFIFLFCVFIISALILINYINKSLMIDRPIEGGSLTEGIIGVPRFVNPVLAISDADKDISSLVYSGLLRKMPDGTLYPDLAEKYEISKDGLSYTFTIKKDAIFQDKKSITSDDVIFTIGKIKDPLIKSPKKANWDGVSVEKIDENNIKFILKQPFASFLENMTLGILPEHLWKNLTAEEFSFSDYNIAGVGSGPYKISKVNKSAGIPTSYNLSSFKKFILSKPYLNEIIFKFYPNEKDLINALFNGNIDQASSIGTKNAKKLKDNGFQIENTPLPRVFALFFNQNEAPIFTNKAVISAFDKAINKNKIISDVLYGYADAINGPLPAGFLTNNNKEITEQNTEEAINILIKDGWMLGTDGVMTKKSKIKLKDTKSQNMRLEFSISTSDAPELKEAVEMIKNDLGKIGAKIELKTFELGTLNQNVIRPRKYEALFFGQVINHESDLFAFWHSSQRNDPGLNIALYTNSKVDKLLESAFSTLSYEDRQKKYAQFEMEVEKDMPAVFIYSPQFIYATNKNLKGLTLNNVSLGSDRFSNVYQWYKETESIWKIFKK